MCRDKQRYLTWFLFFAMTVLMLSVHGMPVFSEDFDDVVSDEIDDDWMYDYPDKDQRRMDQNIPGVALYYPTYVMPFYYTHKPYSKYLQLNKSAPDSSKKRITPYDMKYQISFSIPFFMNIFDTKINLKGAYTQVSYWQSYNDDPYFRETNYQPEGFLEYNWNPMVYTAFGMVHQSNGRGGKAERSWNRIFSRFIFSGSNWKIIANCWYQMNPADETTNPNIRKFLGYGNLILVYKIWENEFSIESYNFVESRLKRSSVRLGWSYPLYNRMRLYLTYFNGYGQSLIEYNSHVNSIGFGLSLNDWL